MILEWDRPPSRAWGASARAGELSGTSVSGSAHLCFSQTSTAPAPLGSRDLGTIAPQTEEESFPASDPGKETVAPAPLSPAGTGCTVCQGAVSYTATRRSRRCPKHTELGVGQHLEGRRDTVSRLTLHLKPDPVSAGRGQDSSRNESLISVKSQRTEAGQSASPESGGRNLRKQSTGEEHHILSLNLAPTSGCPLDWARTGRLQTAPLQPLQRGQV